MLRQDPEECLFQFICSSNNHIKRIHGMVERLCREYGTPLHVTPCAGKLPASPRVTLSQEVSVDSCTVERRVHAACGQRHKPVPAHLTLSCVTRPEVVI